MEVDRPSLSAPGLVSELVRPGGLWRDITVVAETGSTNTDLLQAAAAGATSIEAEGAGRVAREELLAGVLRELEDRYRRWKADPDGSGVRQEYESLCDTTGRTVRVELPGGRVITGTAAEIDSHGRL